MRVEPLMKSLTILCLAASIAGGPSSAFGQSAGGADQSAALGGSEKGLAIAAEADRRDTGFADYVADVTMVLRNRNNTESRRRLGIRVLEMDGDGDRSLITFSQPRDIEGTALLTYSHKTAGDDQWIFLPAIKRVKRISSTNRSGPFVGSEFAYEDLVSPELEKYTYKWLRDEVVDDQPAFVVERVPAYENSGYSRQVVWYDTAEYRILRIEYYDRKNDLLKTYVASGYRQYMGRYWRPDRMDMLNHQNGKSTRMLWREYAFGTGLTKTDFNKSKLTRSR